MKTSYKSLNRVFFLGLLFAILATSQVACIKTSPAPTVTASGSFLEMVNASQISAPQDVYFGGVKTIFTLGYGQTSGFQSITPGTYTVAFNASSTTNVSATANLTFGPGYYTAYFTDDGSVLSVFEDRTAPQPGKARIGFVQVSSAITTNPVDIYITGGSKIVSGLYDKTSSPYYDIDPATTSFSLTVSGSSTILLNMPVTLAANHLYTIYISGVPSKPLDYHLLPEDL